MTVAEAIAAAADAHGDLPPPWAKHPEIPSGSIGWRMGYGESWVMLWHAWLAGQPRTREHRLAYLRRHPPAPRPWAGTVASVLDATDDDDDDDDDDDEVTLAARLRAEGLLGDDVAFPAWVTLQSSDPAAPWGPRRASPSPRSAARYGARELTFWARWCAAARDDRRLEAWLRDAAPPAAGWETLHATVRTGMSPERSPEDSWEWLALAITADGWPAPPWIRGESPDSLHEDFDDDGTPADAWSLWVLEAIDDRTTWNAYLARHGGIPPEWTEAVAREVWLPE